MSRWLVGSLGQGQPGLRQPGSSLPAPSPKEDQGPPALASEEMTNTAQASVGWWPLPGREDSGRLELNPGPGEQKGS